MTLSRRDFLIAATVLVAACDPAPTAEPIKRVERVTLRGSSCGVGPAFTGKGGVAVVCVPIPERRRIAVVSSGRVCLLAIGQVAEVGRDLWCVWREREDLNLWQGDDDATP